MTQIKPTTLQICSDFMQFFHYSWVKSYAFSSFEGLQKEYLDVLFENVKEKQYHWECGQALKRKERQERKVV